MIGLVISAAILLVLIRVVIGDQTDFVQCLLWLGGSQFIAWLVSYGLSIMQFPPELVGIIQLLLGPALFFIWLRNEYSDVPISRFMTLIGLFIVCSFIPLFLMIGCFGCMIS